MANVSAKGARSAIPSPVNVVNEFSGGSDKKKCVRCRAKCKSEFANQGCGLFWRSSLLDPDRVSRGDRGRCGWLGGEGEDGHRLTPLYEGEYIEELGKELGKEKERIELRTTVIWGYRREGRRSKSHQRFER